MNQQDIKKMMEAYQSVVSEKTLTPAEKKKREEIAKAMEKDNPDMPMDKKMAIATATAKRVAEAAGKDIAAKMMKSKSMKAFAAKVARMPNVSAGDLEKMLPDYVSGAEIRGLFKEVTEGPDYLGDIRRKKERDEKKKASQHAGETQRQRMMRKAYGNYMVGLKKEEVDLEEGRGEALKAFEALVKRGGIDRATFQKAYDLYKATKFNELKKMIRDADTDVSEAIAELIQRHDSKAFNSMYPKAKSGDYLRNIVKEKSFEQDLESLDEKSCGKDRMKKESDDEDKKLDPVNKKAVKKDFDDRDDKDIDNDGDVDDSDEYLHKRRKAVGKAMDKDKKGGTAEISKIGEAFEDLWSALEEAAEPATRKKNATPPEGLTDKESPKSKEFIAKHTVDLEDEEKTHQTATDAGRATKAAATRPGDNKAGDKNVVNPVKEDTRTYQQKIMDVLSGKTWGEIANEVEEAQNKEE